MKYTKPLATKLIDYNEKMMDDQDKSIRIASEIIPCICIGGPDNLKKKNVGDQYLYDTKDEIPYSNLF